jgi:hypothetical protein
LVSSVHPPAKTPGDVDENRYFSDLSGRYGLFGLFSLFGLAPWRKVKGEMFMRLFGL